MFRRAFHHYSRAIEWIADEHVKIIDYFKKYTPAKQLKNRRYWPFYLWISASIHFRYEDYSKRIRFNKALEDASRIHPRMTVLKPVQQWDPEDTSLVSILDKQLTGNGWVALWNAIDCAISYFDSKVVPHIIENKNKNQFHYRRNHNSGGTRQPRQHGDRDHTSDFRRRKLPTPPRH